MNNNEELNKKQRFLTRGAVIYASLLLTIPGIIGGVLFIFQRSFITFEVMYVVFGILGILFCLIRNWARDGRNYKKNGSIVEDKDTIEYKNHKHTQMVVLMAAFLSLAISLIFFIIRISVEKGA